MQFTMSKIAIGRVCYPLHRVVGDQDERTRFIDAAMERRVRDNRNTFSYQELQENL